MSAAPAIKAVTPPLARQGALVRRQSQLLRAQLQATQASTTETAQRIQATLARTEQVRRLWLDAHADATQLRYSAVARMQARLASLSVIEQAKGVIMTRYGWPEDQAIDALRRASQRDNIKVRDLAALIVAGTARPAPAHRQPRRPAASRGTPAVAGASP